MHPDRLEAAGRGAAPPKAPASPAEENVALIARLEAEALQQRRWSERISSAIAHATGNLHFVLLHAAVFAAWFVINFGLLPGVHPFDPFPFGILTLFVSAEGVFLAIFVLISQNRAARLADRRAHLDLQVSLLAEQEMTKVLQMLQRVCAHLHVPIEGHEEVKQLMRKTDVNKLVTDLDEKLPSSERRRQ